MVPGSRFSSADAGMGILAVHMSSMTWVRTSPVRGVEPTLPRSGGPAYVRTLETQAHPPRAGVPPTRRSLPDEPLDPARFVHPCCPDVRIRADVGRGLGDRHPAAAPAAGPR